MDYEPITNELRDYAGVAWEPWAAAREHLLQMCDNIDAIHRSLESENECLRDASERGDDWIKLPVDADGVPIHIGDTLEWSDGTTFEVIGIGDGTLYYLDSDKDGHISIAWTSTELKRHYRPDTWESIIEDAINTHGNGFNPSWTETRDALVARCKALCERTREGEE